MGLLGFEFLNNKNSLIVAQIRSWPQEKFIIAFQLNFPLLEAPILPDYTTAPLPQKKESGFIKVCAIFEEMKSFYLVHKVY